MTRVRPGQIWERKLTPRTVVQVEERVADKVTYRLLSAPRNDVITVSVISFKQMYRRLKKND